MGAFWDEALRYKKKISARQKMNVARSWVRYVESTRQSAPCSVDLRCDQPFADRRLREVLELTSRENTDKVAAAKEALGKPCSDPKNGVAGFGTGGGLPHKHRRTDLPRDLKVAVDAAMDAEDPEVAMDTGKQSQTQHQHSGCLQKFRHFTGRSRHPR